MLINAGVKDVYMRDSKEKYRHELVENWIENDDTIY